jgi:hypothetical protein
VSIENSIFVGLCAHEGGKPLSQFKYSPMLSLPLSINRHNFPGFLYGDSGN